MCVCRTDVLLSETEGKGQRARLTTARQAKKGSFLYLEQESAPSWPG